MKRYAFAGASGRALYMFARPMVSELKDFAEPVGVYDISIERAKLLSKQCNSIPVFNNFDEMINVTKPDTVIVATIDRYHHEYIIKSLQAGCDVITEKPMTIDDEKCRAILAVEKSTGKKVHVTFNVRFMPYAARVKELINAGVVGDIISVHMEWMLDTKHGADYFRRWHRRLENSGGLLVHKSTHHFDMVNWWIDKEPMEVLAYGTRKFYGGPRSERSERCLGCKYAGKCKYFWDITKDEFARELYYNTENDDGYIRDKCVFDDEIDIYDTMSLNVKYSNNVLLNYSLIAHCPYEGWRVSINGTEGRIEASNFYSGHRADETREDIVVFNRKSEVATYSTKKDEGDHGGGDEMLRRMLFMGDIEDKLGQMADSMAGAKSLLIGVAANTSIKENRPVTIDSLLHKKS